MVNGVPTRYVLPEKPETPGGGGSEVNRGVIGAIIGVLVIIILVIVIMRMV